MRCSLSPPSVVCRSPGGCPTNDPSRLARARGAAACNGQQLQGARHHLYKVTLFSGKLCILIPALLSKIVHATELYVTLRHLDEDRFQKDVHPKDCQGSLLKHQIRSCRRREPWQTAEQQRTEQELQAKSVAKSVTAISSRRSPRTAPRFVSRLGAGAGPRRGGKSRSQKPPFSVFNLASKGRRSLRRRRGDRRVS